MSFSGTCLVFIQRQRFLRHIEVLTVQDGFLIENTTGTLRSGIGLRGVQLDIELCVTSQTTNQQLVQIRIL